jgi:DNA primase
MDQVEEVKKRLDIVDIVGGYIALNKAGGNFKAVCPFHNEKTPSFMVSREKQIWHCFGCDKGGDVLTFVQEYEGIDFPAALKILADKANVTLTNMRFEAKQDHSRLYEANRLAVEFYQANLDKNNKVLDYLRNRKINQDSIAKWQLGLSGEKWDDLYQYLLSKKFTDQEMFQAGLILKQRTGTGYFDRFRKRLMFPICDTQGRIVAFTSRTLHGIVYDEEEPGGKYINSPQSVIYDKSRILYGWHLAKDAIRKQKYLIIVEGNMDAIASYQANTQNTVAVSGTALTIDHIKLIKRYTNNVILAFDGDAAGSRAVFRSITLGWQEELNLKILLLQKDKDPADIISEDPEIWRQAIKDSAPVMDYYFKRIIAGVDLNRADHKKLAVQKLLPIIKFLKSNIEQVHYLKLLSDKLQIPLELLQSNLNKAEVFIKSEDNAKLSETNIKTTAYSLCEQLLSLVFSHNKYLEKMVADIDPDMIEESLRPLYRKVIIYYTKHQNLENFTNFSELVNLDKEQWIKLSLLGEETYSDTTASDLDNTWRNLFYYLKNQSLQDQRQDLITKLRQAELSNNTAEQDIVTHKINLINKEIQKIQP